MIKKADLLANKSAFYFNLREENILKKLFKYPNNHHSPEDW